AGADERVDGAGHLLDLDGDTGELVVGRRGGGGAGGGHRRDGGRRSRRGRGRSRRRGRGELGRGSGSAAGEEGEEGEGRLAHAAGAGRAPGGRRQARPLGPVCLATRGESRGGALQLGSSRRGTWSAAPRSPPSSAISRARGRCTGARSAPPVAWRIWPRTMR